jgi:predicted RNA polymerase sigma factor
VSLNRAVAVAMIDGPQSALVQAYCPQLDRRP